MLFALTSALLIQAQAQDTVRAPVPVGFNAITVTATRSERSTFDSPQPVTVIDSARLREKAAGNAIDLFRDLAGLDASGAGANQRRPEIRLQRGQRILLLMDGLRLNNARRQQDFGELPALAGINAPARIEVVRGPSSVLYGTDAIGGVVNIISGRAQQGLPSGHVSGMVSYRYASAGNAKVPSGLLATRIGRLAAQGGVSWREASDYTAPAGSFGSLSIPGRTTVFDSGIRDRSAFGLASFALTERSELYGRLDAYHADKAGFGFVDPALLGANQPRIRIIYPDQRYTRLTSGYRATFPSLFLADRADIAVYSQRNQRDLQNLVFVPISATASVDSRSYNFTDLRTIGGRLELAKSILSRHTLTYGLDGFRDRSTNTDSSRSITTGFGPAPIVRTSNVPSVPNATFRSAGAFVQLELNPWARLSTVFGGRLQEVFAETDSTPNVTRPLVSGTHRTGVWSANALYRVADGLNLVTAVGRGFRSPNLVERFFQGVATEINALQIANPALEPETSLNVDLGTRYRTGPLVFETFVFRNDIRNAIRPMPTGRTVSGRPEFQNRNIGKLRVDGIEAIVGLQFRNGLAASLNGTRFDADNVTRPGEPVSDSYSSKLAGELDYRAPGGLFSLGWTGRHQGATKDVIVGTNPIGPVVPAFTVHAARAGMRLPRQLGNSSLNVAVDNVTDRLYAEFPNAGFFRPEPGRNTRVSVMTSF